MRVLNVKQGSAVAVQNSENKGVFYIVKSGILEVDSEHRLSDKALSRFEAGDSFGMVSALTGHRFLVTVFAKTDAEVIEIPIQMMGSYLINQKSLAIRMMSLYTRELRTIHKHLSMANQPDDRYVSPKKLIHDAKIYMELGKPKYASYALYKYLDWLSKECPDAEQESSAKELLAQTKSNYKGKEWSSSEVSLSADEVIFLENEVSNEIYVVKSGSVKLFTITREQELIIDILGPGEIFGEMAVIDHFQRMASAVTETDTVIMRFTKQTLFDHDGVAILQKIFESLARRIWFSHQRLIILRIPDPVTRLYAFIFNLTRDQDIKNKTWKNTK